MCLIPPSRSSPEGAGNILHQWGKRKWREVPQTLTNTDSFYPIRVCQEDASFTNSKYTMHIPLGKMNTFLLTCLYLSFTYVHASLMSPAPAPCSLSDRFPSRSVAEQGTNKRLDSLHHERKRPPPPRLTLSLLNDCTKHSK